MFFNFCRRIFEGFTSTGLEYGTTGLHLSAISTFHELTVNFSWTYCVSVGKQSIICKLLIGIINKNPLKTKYFSM